MTSGLFADLPVQVVPEREGGGRPRLRPAERGQMELRAVSLDDLVPADHRVRLVWRFVEGLDLSALLAEIKAVEGRPGHPPADPRILMALWLFAIIEGIGSARALARRCEESLPFQRLCGGVGMNHKTLSDFRVGQGTVLERLLVDSFAALLVSGVAGLGRGWSRAWLVSGVAGLGRGWSGAGGAGRRTGAGLGRCCLVPPPFDPRCVPSSSEGGGGTAAPRPRRRSRGCHPAKQASRGPRGCHPAKQASRGPRGCHPAKQASRGPRGCHPAKQASRGPRGDVASRGGGAAAGGRGS